MRCAFVLAIAGLFSSTAFAQTITINRDPAPSAFRAPQSFDAGTTRVQVSIQVNRAAVASSTQDQLAAQEDLRHVLYDSVARECGIIGETFKADCRIASLNMSSNSGNGGNANMFANASVTFALTPKPPAPN